MIRLSDHFSLNEFAIGGDIPAWCIPAYAVLCEKILEPVHEQFGKMWITSGYRSPMDNDAAHGQPNSEHMATADWCAADFFCAQVAKAFDYMRNSPTLPYHQLLLEKGKVGSIIHVSWNRLKPGTRSVLTGTTHNSQPPVPATYVAFNPIPEINA